MSKEKSLIHLGKIAITYSSNSKQEFSNVKITKNKKNYTIYNLETQKNILENWKLIQIKNKLHPFKQFLAVKNKEHIEEFYIAHRNGNNLEEISKKLQLPKGKVEFRKGIFCQNTYTFITEHLVVIELKEKTEMLTHTYIELI